MKHRFLSEQLFPFQIRIIILFLCSGTLNHLSSLQDKACQLRSKPKCVAMYIKMLLVKTIVFLFTLN